MSLLRACSLHLAGLTSSILGNTQTLPLGGRAQFVVQNEPVLKKTLFHPRGNIFGYFTLVVSIQLSPTGEETGVI